MNSNCNYRRHVIRLIHGLTKILEIFFKGTSTQNPEFVRNSMDWISIINFWIILGMVNVI